MVDVAPDGEDAAASQAREQKLAWMRERDYRVLRVRASEVGVNADAVLSAIVEAAGQGIA